MDLRFTPHDDRPRSTHEPLQSSPTSHLQQHDEVTVSVAMVRPGNGMLSNTGRENKTDEGGRGGGETNTLTFGPTSNNLVNGNGEREENGRPNSAPARTPNSAGPNVMEVTGTASNGTPMRTCPRPRVSRPHLSLPTDNVHDDTGDNEPSSVGDRSGSPDDIDSSDLREDATPELYTELSPGPSGETRYQCHFCSFSTQHLLHMKHHLVNHNEHKMMKCALCGFSTGEKAQFRRHKRLHQRTNPTSMLHCDKCHFSTLVPRKMREHYSRLHNADFGTSFIATSMHMRSSTFNANPGFNRMTAGCSSDSGYFVDMGTSPALHAYRLSQPRGMLQFEPTDPSSTVLATCGSAGFAPPAGLAGFRYDAGRRLVLPADTHAPSDRITSIMSNMVGHPRVPATSTITSCEYPARPANPHRPDLNNFSPLRGSSSCFRDPFAWQPISSPSRTRHIVSTPHGEGVKVKTEPLDCDGVSDVSSSGVSGMFERERGGPNQDRPQRYVEPQTTTTQSRYQRPLYEPLITRSTEQSDEIAPSGGDVSRVSQSSEAASSRVDARAESVEDGERGERRGSGGEGDSLSHHLLCNIKSETSNVAVQCSGSSGMKSESVPTVTVAAAEHSTECRRVHHLRVERGVQCELLSSSPRRVTSRTLSTDSEQQSVSGSDTRCSHCGITFDDEVLFSIHIGCHSHTDPFVCNVCGKKCQNKYGFYSHIMRGHHF